MAERVDVLMPLEQEGSKSVVRAWLKKVGDAVKRDEPLLELETDKVAVEVPAPCDGVLAEIALHEGDEAAPGAVLGVLSTALHGPPASSPASLHQAQPRAGEDAGGPYSDDCLQPLGSDQVKQLQGEAVGPLLAALPLAHRIFVHRARRGRERRARACRRNGRWSVGAMSFGTVVR